MSGRVFLARYEQEKYRDLYEALIRGRSRYLLRKLELTAKDLQTKTKKARQPTSLFINKYQCLVYDDLADHPSGVGLYNECVNTFALRCKFYVFL